MRRLSILAALVALEACAPDAAPAPPSLPPSAAQKPKPATPAPQPPAPAPMEKSTPAPPAEEASKPPAPATPRIRRPMPPPGEIHLPSFTFRTMDHKAAKVWLNGEEMSETPCLWTITETLEFDPKISVAQWPPEGARYAGSTQHREHPDLKAEVYFSPAKPPSGESVVYVSASLGGRRLQGALRIRVEGYHFIDYTPLVNPEGEEASRLQRTIWFERTQNE